MSRVGRPRHAIGLPVREHVGRHGCMVRLSNQEPAVAVGSDDHWRQSRSRMPRCCGNAATISRKCRIAHRNAGQFTAMRGRVARCCVIPNDERGAPRRNAAFIDVMTPDGIPREESFISVKDPSFEMQALLPALREHPVAVVEFRVAVARDAAHRVDGPAADGAGVARRLGLVLPVRRSGAGHSDRRRCRRCAPACCCACSRPRGRCSS